MEQARQARDAFCEEIRKGPSEGYLEEFQERLSKALLLGQPAAVLSIFVYVKDCFPTLKPVASSEIARVSQLWLV